MSSSQRPGSEASVWSWDILFVMPSPDAVVKLSGDNSSEEKERVMRGFLEGLVMDLDGTQCRYNCLECRLFRVLISTDCVGHYGQTRIQPMQLGTKGFLIDSLIPTLLKKSV